MRACRHRVCASGDWRFDPTSYELERLDRGARTRLPRRLGRILERLASSPGEVVSREALIGSAWDRSGVGDDVLSRSINALRDALGDDARAPRYLETIPKSGYRLVAAVSREPEAAAPVAAPDTAVRARSPRLRAIGLAAIVVAAAVAFVFGERATNDGPVSIPLLSLDLARERPLTSAAGWELGPALSPDGRWLAHTEIDTPDGPSRLVVSELDGGGRRVVIETEGASNARPVFSPDGSELAFRRVASERCSVVVGAVLTLATRTIAECATVMSGIDWSADDRLVYTAPAREGQAPGLAIVTLATGESDVLTQPSLAEGADADPRFTPDGRRVSFARGRGSDRAVYAVARDAPQTVEVLFPGDNLIQGHAWTPDGRTLVVATDAKGYRSLVALDVASGAQTVLGARGARFPAIGHDGHLVYELAQYDANVWRVDLTGDAPPLRLTTSSRYDAFPAIAPDGNRFAFVSVRDGLDAVFVGAVDRAAEQRLPLPREHRWVRPRWHPDGRTLLVTAYLGDTTQVWRHEIASGRTRALAELGDAFGAQDTADGNGVVFARSDATGYQLWVSSRGEPPRALHGAGGVDEFHLGDGFVAYTRHGERGIVLHELASGARRSVLADEIGIDGHGDWTVRDDALVYARRDPEGGARLIRYDPVDGASGPLAAAEPGAVGASIAVDPSWRYALVARTDALEIDLMSVPLR